jgi:hypothetical protein
LFGTEVPAISKYIKNILNFNELEAEATISKMEIVRMEGTRKIKRIVDHYNLDMIISTNVHFLHIANSDEPISLHVLSSLRNLCKNCTSSLMASQNENSEFPNFLPKPTNCYNRDAITSVRCFLLWLNAAENETVLLHYAFFA